MQYRGDKMQAMVLRNNGFCECAPLGGECGCTKWEDTYTGGSSDAPEEKEVRVYECPAPMCCQTGVCAHNESAWGGIYGPPGTLTEWRDLEDTREYLTNQERKAARATREKDDTTYGNDTAALDASRAARKKANEDHAALLASMRWVAEAALATGDDG